jgi:hypothetical protein
MSKTLEWTGPQRRFDLVKEVTLLTGLVGVAIVVLSFLFRVPDDSAITFKSWAGAAPSDFVTTAVAELNGSSTTAGYGQPYNDTAAAAQKIGPISPQKLGGLRIPINTANDFVLKPLETVSGDPQLTEALAAYRAAPDKQQTDWGTSYGDALAKAPDNDPAKVEPGDYGSVPVLSQKLLAMANSGALDGALASGTDTTKALLFIGDGSFLGDQADAQLLAGDHWGMVNSSGHFPGQFWLSGFSLWYQINPFKSSGNADVLAFATLGILTLLVTFLPWIPGLRSVPRWLRLHHLIWWPYYRQQRQSK